MSVLITPQSASWRAAQTEAIGLGLQVGKLGHDAGMAPRALHSPRALLWVLAPGRGGKG